MPSPRHLLAACAATALVAGATLPASASDPHLSPDTVTISGNAYAFIFAGNNDRLPGAVISVDQIPGRSVTAGANGAYSITVPDHRNITLHATAAGYHEVYTQTFHTSGRDLTQVNFQMPANQIFTAMAALAGAGLDASGNLTGCAIVSTLFQKEGRDFPSFDEFHDFHPHGIAGATVTRAGTAAPTYFNASVLPDPGQQTSSRDGGVVWKDVATGRYTLSATSPDHRFASFVADCEPGRFINASPPWGLYELKDGEQTNPAALAAPSVTLTATSGTPDRSGRHDKFAVRVEVAGGGGAPADHVALYDGSTMLRVVPLTDGVGTATVTLHDAGEHSLSAVYGSGAAASASAPVAVSIP